MLELNSFEWRKNTLTLTMENGYKSQIFGYLVKKKSLIINNPEEFEGPRVEFNISKTSSIQQLLDFIKEFDNFNWQKSIAYEKYINLYHQLIETRKKNNNKESDQEDNILNQMDDAYAKLNSIEKEYINNLPAAVI